MTKKSQKVKKNFKSRKNKKLLKDEGIKHGLLQHLEPQKIDHTQVQNCILNRTYENDDILIRNNANNNGANPFVFTESMLKELGLF
jgi:hypothetical protein